MTEPQDRLPRSIRAKLIGLGLDGSDDPKRIVHGRDCLMIGGSDQTRDEMVELAQRLEMELERLGRGLGEVTPGELAVIGWRIDSPELVRAALRIDTGMRAAGRQFGDLSADELTALAWCDASMD